MGRWPQIPRYGLCFLQKIDNLSISLKYWFQPAKPEKIMYTSTNSYTKKISSGTILALLALSGTLLLVPAISSVNAASNIPPVLTLTNNQYFAGGNSPEVDFNITNPSTNQYGISYVNITLVSTTAPWTFLAATCAAYSLPGNTGNHYFTTVNCGEAPANTQGQILSAWWSTVGSFTLPPGGSQDLAVNVDFPSYSTYGAQCATITSEVHDTDGGHYAANSMQLCNFSPSASLSLYSSVGSASDETFIAGSSPVTVWAKLGLHESGVGVFFQGVNGEIDCGIPSLSTFQFADLCKTTNVGTFSGTGITQIDPFLVEAWTNATGVAVVTYTPLNVAPSNMRLTAYIGGGPTCEGYWTNAESPVDGGFGCNTWYSQSNTIRLTTLATTPTVLSFLLGTSAFPATHYVTAFATVPNGGVGNDMAFIAGYSVYLDVADQFGNDITLDTFTHLTASVSTSSAGGLFDLAGVNKTTVTVGDSGVDSTDNGVAVNYYQSGIYGSIGMLSSLVSGTYPVTHASFSLSANSGNIFTANFDTPPQVTSPFPKPTCPDCGGTLPAVSNETVAYKTTFGTVGILQQGVPTTFYALNDTVPTAFNGMPVIYGFWVGGTQPWDALTGEYNITVNTDVTGKATAMWTTDSTFGSTVIFSYCVPTPTDTAPTSTTCSHPTSALSTTFNTAVGIFVNTFFDVTLLEPTHYAFTDKVLYVDVFLVDQYGNVAENTFGAQIQIALAASAGTLSASAPYIASGSSDTAIFPSFGPVTWTTAGTAPTAITLTATANIPGNSIASTSTDTVNVVSDTPYFTAAATSGNTYGGITYSKTLAVSFGGNATVSLGWDPSLGVNFAAHGAGVFYKIDNGAWVKTSTSSSSSYLWKAINVVFTQGLHTITFNATDSKGDVSSPVTLEVLVDTSTPTVTFGTGQSTTSAGTPLAFSVTDSEGDLNLTGGVWATSNSSATLTTTLVSGTNKPGSPVTYNFTVAGLPATNGHWGLTLHATNLAGTTATTTVVIKVTVSYAVSVSVSNAAMATIGGYTGIQATVTNGWTSSQSVIMFAVWTSATTGYTVCVGTGAYTGLASGASATLFAACPGLASGPYTVNVFVVTTTNNPVSAETTLSVTV